MDGCGKLGLDPVVFRVPVVGRCRYACRTLSMAVCLIDTLAKGVSSDKEHYIQLNLYTFHTPRRHLMVQGPLFRRLCNLVVNYPRIA